MKEQWVIEIPFNPAEDRTYCKNVVPRSKFPDDWEYDRYKRQTVGSLDEAVIFDSYEGAVQAMLSMGWNAMEVRNLCNILMDQVE